MGQWDSIIIMFIVISYDITDDKRRTKVMKTLKNFGNHIQYSVFECDLPAPTYLRLRAQLEKLISHKEDNLRFYFLDADAIKKIQVLGSDSKPVLLLRETVLIPPPL